MRCTHKWIARCTAAGLIVGAGPLALAVPAGAAALPELSESWSFSSSARIHNSSPAVADVNGDGTDDVAYGDLDGYLHIRNGVNGAEIAGWPQRVSVDGQTATAVEASPTIADLDGDGVPEVAVGAGSNWVDNQQGGLEVFNRDGGVRFRYRTDDDVDLPSMNPHPDGYTEGVFSTPAAGDIDGDGHADLVFGAWDNKLHAVDRNGVALPGFPVWVDDTIWSSPALYDADGDGRLEIYIGNDSTAGGSEDWNGGVFHAFKWTASGVQELWKQRTGDVIMGSPVIGDIDGDGRPEAVVNTGDFYHHADNARVFSYHLDNGSQTNGWPVQTGAVNSGGVALGDITGDDGGKPEVVVTSRNGVVYAFRGNGALHFASNLGSGESVSYPIVADVNGDGRQDVIAGTGYATYLLNGANGGQIWEPIGKAWSYQNAAAVGNFGGTWKVVVGGMLPNGGGFIGAYNLPSPDVSPAWPMWRKNAQHLGADPSVGAAEALPPNLCSRPVNPSSTPSDDSAKGYWVLGVDGGVYSFSAPFFGSLPGLGIQAQTVNLVPTQTGNGYWVLSRDGGVFSFGDAAFHGSMGGTPLNAPIISMAATPSGQGYWLLASDGGVFSFGDAAFQGSTGAMRLNQPIIAMAPTNTGQGYWLLALDGGIFSFGDAQFFGSTGGMTLNARVISMAPNPTGDGYWLLASDGGVFSFGVPFYGSIPGTGVCTVPLSMQIRPTVTGHGYWLLAADGGVYSFGDAKFLGAQPGLTWLNYAADLGVRR